MRRWHVLREPTVPILLLASVVHVVRHNVFDFLLFSGTALVIIVESRIELRRVGVNEPGALPPPPPLPHHRRWWAATALAVVSAVVALLPAAGGLTRVVLAACGVIVLALVVAKPASRPPGGESGKTRGWQLWATVGVGTCLWELFSFIAQQVWPADQIDHPAISDLVGPTLATWAGRAVLLLLWVSAGWWLVRQLVGSGGTAARVGSEATGPPATPVISGDEAIGDDGAASRAGDADGRTEARR